MASQKEKSGRGLVQVFTGNGKGKTTAALGTILRAAGHGLRVFIVFFLKGDYAHGEYQSLAGLPNVDVAGFGLRRIVDRDNVDPQEIEQAGLALAAARDAALGGKYDLVVLDEVNIALEYRLIKVEDVIELIEKKPAGVELILTGRYAADRIMDMADLVTEMVNIKHPYEQGVNARKGIEY